MRSLESNIIYEGRTDGKRDSEHVPVLAVFKIKISKLGGNAGRYKSFLENTLRDNKIGIAIQHSNTNVVTNSPPVPPKKALNTAPVYPINADISIFIRTIMRARSIGLRKLKIIIGFSKG